MNQDDVSNIQLGLTLTLGLTIGVTVRPGLTHPWMFVAVIWGAFALSTCWLIVRRRRRRR